MRDGAEAQTASNEALKGLYGLAKERHQLEADGHNQTVEHYNHTLRNVGEDEKFLNEVIPDGENLEDFALRWVANRNSAAFAAATSSTTGPAGPLPDVLPTPAPATNDSWNLTEIAGSYSPH